MSEDIVKESIKCLANMEIKETTYQVARSVVLDEIERLNKELKSLQDSYDIEEIKKTEISYYRQQELLEKLKEFKEIPELIEQVERLESMLKNDLIIYV